VGIWLSASLVNPHAIGSLIRIFFWAWFTEWIVFVLEVGLLLVFFLTWKRANDNARAKRRHIRIGAALSLASWLTMAIITAILGFMMDSGAWTERSSFASAVLNPIYLPQLMFRTPVAMISAGLLAMFLAYFFTRDDREFRARAVRLMSVWVLAWTPWCLLAGLIYWHAVPGFMADQLPVAVATQAFATWHQGLLALMLVATAVIVVAAAWGLARPRWMPRVALLVPFLLAIGLLSYFERVREFIRKPYVIADYMYANGIRKEDYPLLAEDGLLAHAAYVPARTITPDNHQELGEAMFLIACTRCHTTNGVNSMVAKLDRVFRPTFGSEPWDPETIKQYLRSMDGARPFMPPVPGTDEELGLLAEYLIALHDNPTPVGGAQHGVNVPPGPTVRRDVGTAEDMTIARRSSETEK
jgi:mono/diheme cytochrome c family protein